MAAPRENLLSLGHLTGMDRETFNTITNRKEHSLKKSLNRSMTLQADFSTHQSSQNLRMKHLQQHWQELKERERAAQQHNKLLLQQFEEAQDTLREMMARTAAMKTIRIEYERYLEESSPRWEQQFKEKTEAAQRKRIDEYLKMCLENTEEQVTKSSVDRPLLSQAPTKKPQKVSAPQEYHRQNSHFNYNQDDTLPSTWLTRSQPHTFRFPVRVPYQPQVSSQAPPSFLPHPHPFHLQHLAVTPGHHHPQPRQIPPGWASSQPDHSWFWASGGAGIPSGYEALLGQLYMEEPPHDRGVAPVVADEAETSRAPRSKTEIGGGSRSSNSSQELDIKPVRLSSGHAGSSESSRDSSQASREKKKKKREKRGREQCTSSERESCSSQESSRTSSAIVVASAAAAQTSGSEASSEKGSSSSKKTRRVEDVVAESPRMEKVAKERTRSRGDVHESHNEESHCTGEESEESRSENDGNQSPVEKSESCRDESGCQRDEGSGSVSIQLENGDPYKSEEQESSSSKQSGAGQKVVEGTGHKTELEDGEDDEEGGEDKEPNSQRDEEQEDISVEDDEDDEDDVSASKNAIVEEEEETGAEDEMEEQESDEDQRDDEEQSDKLRNEDDEVRKQASSQDQEVDEDESEGSEDKTEDDDDDDGGSDEEEDDKQRSDKAEVEEERDSDDSIISPQENRPRKINIIPEESAEDNDEMDGNKTGSSNDDSNEISDEDDIEHLLAPQTQTKKTEEKDPKTEEKPKAVCDKVEIFQLTSSKTDQQSDSDEFDHFYD